MNKKQSDRSEICMLTSAEKGSLFESFFMNIIDRSVKDERQSGCNADISYHNRRVKIDLKFHKKRPTPKSRIPYYWLDYMTEKSKETGKANIFKLCRSREPECVYSNIDNWTFETYYNKEWKNRKNRKQKKNNEIVSDVILKKRESRKERIIAKAIKEIDKYYPNGKTRYLKRKMNTAYGGLTVLPAIWSESALKKFNRTILVVGNNDWKEITEYWLFDHKKDRDLIKPLLEDDGRGKLRIRPVNFPKHRIIPFNQRIYKLKKVLPIRKTYL